MSEIHTSFWDHLDDLRSTLIKILIVIALGTLTAFFFYPTIYSYLTKPLHMHSPLYKSTLITERIYNSSDQAVSYSVPTTKTIYTIPPHGSVDIETMQPDNKLIVLSPIDGLATTLKMSFWVGFVFTSPVWIFFLLQFVAPALYKHERKLIFPFLLLTVCFFSLGLAIAYYISIPFANKYLFAFNESIATNLWSLSNYLNYTVILMMGNALAFELCAALLLLVHYGFIGKKAMVSKRKHVIIAILVISALLTPPDIFTQLMLAIPLMILYECTILYAGFRKRMRI